MENNNYKILKLKISGMTCDHCANSISKIFDDKTGIKSKNISYSDGSGIFTFDPKLIGENEISRTINATNSYKVEKIEQSDSDNSSRFDLIIIGGGSAAFSAAIKANELGKSILMINSGLQIGGTCVNVGCVPSKNLIRSAETIFRANNNQFPGIKTGGYTENFKTLMNQKTELVNELREQKYINVVRDMKNFIQIEGHAQIVTPNSVKVNNKTYYSDCILIATGAKPFIPDIEGLEKVPYLDNKSAFELEKLPESIIVMGGRYIALEIAQMFSRLGSKVTILQRSDRILPTESKILTAELTNYLIEEGINVVTGNDIKNVIEENGNIILTSVVDGEEKTFKSEKLIIAAGRKANTDNIGLENVGVKLDKNKFIEVNEYLQTSVPSILAAGDVTGNNMFVYTAAYDGSLAVSNVFSDLKQKTDYSVLPWVIFTDPQVAGVGIDEAEAKRTGIEFDTSIIPLTHIPRSIAAKDTRGFIKLIRNKQNDQLIGARILAPEGSELLMEIAVAIKFGIKVSDIKNMFHPYLTLSEGIKLAIIGFNKNISTLSCCAT